MKINDFRSRWYGKIDEVKILTGSSGTLQLNMTSLLLSKIEFDLLLSDILLLMRAPESVEDE